MSQFLLKHVLTQLFPDVPFVTYLVQDQRHSVVALQIQNSQTKFLPQNTSLYDIQSDPFFCKNLIIIDAWMNQVLLFAEFVDFLKDPINHDSFGSYQPFSVSAYVAEESLHQMRFFPNTTPIRPIDPIYSALQGAVIDTVSKIKKIIE